MARSDVTQIDMLQAVVDRLQAELDLNDRNCYAVARAVDVPSIPPGGNFWLTVAPGSGLFEEEEQSPGNITEDTDVAVTAYTRIKTDSTGHDGFLLMDDARGLLAIKKLILGALCGHDLVNEDEDTFLRQIMYAKRSEAPDLIAAGRDGINCGLIRVVFGVPFDWSV